MTLLTLFFWLLINIVWLSCIFGEIHVERHKVQLCSFILSLIHAIYSSGFLPVNADLPMNAHLITHVRGQGQMPLLFAKKMGIHWYFWFVVKKADKLIIEVNCQNTPFSKKCCPT